MQEISYSNGKELKEGSDRYLNECRQRIKREVLDRLSGMDESDEDEILRIIDECIIEDGREHLTEPNQRLKLRKQLFHSIRRLDVLQELLDDDTVTEIMVNGCENIFVERNGRIENSKRCFESEERLMDIIQQIAADANRTVNMASPILDARLKDGSRVNIVLQPIAIDGPILTIRRFPNKAIDAETLVRYGSVSSEIIEFLKRLVMAGYNILISGNTGSGKTTFLNVLSGFIPKDERIITIEDSAELKIQGIENLVRLEVRNANVEGCKEISIRDLIKSALRMRPDRIVVGEVRGEEAIDMLQAFNVGEDGSISTLHANSAEDALHRLETMIMMSSDIPISAIRRQISSGVDIIIHLTRLRDKSRRLKEIREVIGFKDGEVETRLLFSFEETSEDKGRVIGIYEKKNNVFNKEKLIRAGIKDEL